MMSSKGKIFMLDDDGVILSLYQELFEAKGYDVFATTNAYKLLLYAREIKPDIFILDINMPTLSGWEVLDMIKKDEKLQEIPVIMLSVLRDANLALAKGAAHFLNKPLEMDALTDIVESYCLGNKNHDVLLFEDFDAVDSPFERSIKESRMSLFQVHELQAAKRYLSKNKPRVVCLCLSDEANKKAHEKLEHEHIVDVTKDGHIKDVMLHL